MRIRTRYSLLLIFVLLAALATALFLRKSAPPEVARLLPESDAIVYVNLRPIRSVTHFDREWLSKPVTHSAEYQQFLDATGIVFERDLDAVAFALHRMDDPNGPNGPVAYSEVFEGRFDGARLARYLASIASGQESYAGHQIFTIPVAFATATPAGTKPDLGGTKTTAVRSLRVAQLGYDTLAASNMPTAEQIHSILDRYRASASPFSGSSLLSARYREVPLLSSAWAIGHIGLPFSENGRISAFGLQLPLFEDTDLIASLRFTPSLHLRIEEMLPTQMEADRSAHALTALLQLFRSVQSLQSQIGSSRGGTSTPQVPAQAEAIARFLDSVKVVPEKNRAVLTAVIPADLIKQLTESSDDSAADHP